MSHRARRDESRCSLCLPAHDRRTLHSTNHVISVPHPKVYHNCAYISLASPVLKVGAGLLLQGASGVLYIGTSITVQ